MKKILAFLLIAGISVQAALCQTAPLSNTAHADAVARVVGKYQTVILYAQLLPLNFKKPQWDSILDAVDAARTNVRKTEDNEYNVMVGDEKLLDDMIDAAKKNGQEPDIKKLDKFVTDLANLRKTRSLIGSMNTGSVLAAVKKAADDGQIKGMEHSLDIHALDPSLDPSKMTDDDKLKFFVQTIFLNPDAYPIMVQLSAIAPKK